MTLSAARIILQSVCVYHLWDDSDRGKSKRLGQKTVLLPLCPTQIIHRPLVLIFFIPINARKVVFVMNIYIDLINKQYKNNTR